MSRGPASPPPAPGLGSEDLEPETARELVAEAFHTFGEPAARRLAVVLGVPFEACREAIERSQYRLQ